MSGSNSFTRLLSIRDKRRNGSKNHLDVSNLFTIEEKSKRLSKDEEKKVQELSQRLLAHGIKDVPQQRIEYALRSKSAQGDVKEAFKVLMLYEDSVAGVIRHYDPTIKMLGAENREKTTCYLDSLMFAMFAKSDVFEAILFNNFTDEPRKRLITTMRLWVNLLRSGRLVTTDIIAKIQESLAECGWQDAAKVRQQDVSEAFAFITDKLELPLLTLKTDIYHSGKEDLKDDHKFITERMLDVALPENVPAGVTITLEMCLEEYFNNRVEVKRHLQRRGTTESLAQPALGVRKSSVDKVATLHVEAVEVDPRDDAPALEKRTTDTDKMLTPQRPTHMRTRATSIFSERKVPIDDKPDKPSAGESGTRARANSVRKEVLMPAWQFLNLIPWYADNALPENQAQIRQHFSTKRPMLGICLKRYSVTPRGGSQRIGTHIDIPLEMASPHFDAADGEGESPKTSNFKLSLQSVVCHRGHSVEAGHYVSLVRTSRQAAAAYSNSNIVALNQDGDSSEDTWLLFDDLAMERVRPVDINRALREESAYLLFYRVQHIDDNGHSHEAPPPYENSEASFDLVDEKLSHLSQPSNASGQGRESLEIVEYPSRRPSDNAASPEEGRGRASADVRRTSIQWQNGRGTSRSESIRTDALSTEPTTPLEEMKSSSSAALSRTSTKGQRFDSQLRTNGDSASPTEKRFSVSGISRMASKLSREKPVILTGTSPEIYLDDVPISEETPAPSRISKEESPDNVRSRPPKERKRMFHTSSRRSSGNKEKKGTQPDRDCIVM